MDATLVSEYADVMHNFAIPRTERISKMGKLYKLIVDSNEKIPVPFEYLLFWLMKSNYKIISCFIGNYKFILERSLHIGTNDGIVKCNVLITFEIESSEEDRYGCCSYKYDNDMSDDNLIKEVMKTVPNISVVTTGYYHNTGKQIFQYEVLKTICVYSYLFYRMSCVNDMMIKVLDVLKHIRDKYNVEPRYTKKCGEIVALMEKTSGNIEVSIEIQGMCLVDNIGVATIMSNNLVFHDHYCKVIGVSSNLNMYSRILIINFLIKIYSKKNKDKEEKNEKSEEEKEDNEDIIM